MNRYVHRFWAGDRPMPEEYVQFGKDWERLNPGWTLVEWDESHISENTREHPQIQAVIDHLYFRDQGRRSIELFVQLADVMGYMLVLKYGGVYVNTDMQPVRTLEGRLPDKAWASLENNEDGRIVNASIGAPRNHDLFWVAVVTDLPGRYWANPLAEMVETTGPAHLTDMAKRFPLLLHVFPVETFNPVHWKQIEPGQDASEWLDSLPEETIALHHWGHKKDGRTNRIEGGTR